MESSSGWDVEERGPTVSQQYTDAHIVKRTSKHSRGYAGSRHPPAAGLLGVRRAGAPPCHQGREKKEARRVPEETVHEPLCTLSSEIPQREIRVSMLRV